MDQLEHKIVSFNTAINVRLLKKIILKNEKPIIKKYKPVTDGYTQLGPDSLTARSACYNVLDWKEAHELKKGLRQHYDIYTHSIGELIYVQCWANVMRKGEQIRKHFHGGTIYDHVSGHFYVNVDTTTSTHYVLPTKTLEHKNKNGVMTLFPSAIPHYTNQYDGKGTRITIAFDIKTKEGWQKDVFDQRKPHWVLV